MSPRKRSSRASEWTLPTVAVLRQREREALVGGPNGTHRPGLGRVTRSATTELPVDNTPLRCPVRGCGRVQAADMMLLLDAFPRGKRPDAYKDAPFCCDACQERLYREGKVSKSALYETMGAPKALVEKVRERERDNE